MYLQGIRINILSQHRARSRAQGFRPLTLAQYVSLAVKILAS